jgi:Rrf2 family protein
MKLSTRARYGMRVMLTLAVHYDRGPMYLKDIAEAEEISEKYLSLLVIPLRQAGLIHSIRGAYGGYSLAKDPSQINLGEIVEVLEGDSIVDCLKNPSA